MQNLIDMRRYAGSKQKPGINWNQFTVVKLRHDGGHHMIRVDTVKRWALISYSLDMAR